MIGVVKRGMRNSESHFRIDFKKSNRRQKVETENWVSVTLLKTPKQNLTAKMRPMFNVVILMIKFY